MKGLASFPTVLWMKRGLQAYARQSLGCSPAQPIPADFDDSFSKALLNSGRSHFERGRHLFCGSTGKWSWLLSSRGWATKAVGKGRGYRRNNRECAPGRQVRKNREPELCSSPTCSFSWFTYIQGKNMNVHISFDFLLSVCTSRFTDFTALPSETIDAEKQIEETTTTKNCLEKKIYIFT